MKLGDIEDLQLYVDREIEYEEGHSEVKRILLEDDLDVGETGYFDQDGIKRNKVKKLDDNIYMFYRFDEIQTHIKEYDSDYTIEDFKKEVLSNLDYEGLKYSSDRVALVEKLLEENNGIYDLLSSNRIIEKEQKSTKDFLSTEQRLDKIIDVITNYILHSKYSDSDEEDYIENTKDFYTSLRKKSGKTEQEIKEMYDTKDEIDLFNHGIISRNRERRNTSRENVKEESVNFDSDRVISDVSEFNTDISKVEYVGRDLVIDDGYWDRKGLSTKGGDFRKEILQQYEHSLNIMAKQLGYKHDENDSVKDVKPIQLAELESVRYTDESGNSVYISSPRRLSMLKNMYSELKSDYYATKEMLANPLNFSTALVERQKIDYNFDTYYKDSDGELIELSKNTVLFSDMNTYKGLINNYYDLKDKYYDDFQDDMWYILLTFEGLIEKTELADEERFIIDRIMRDYPRKEIIEEYEKEFGRSISMRVLSSRINRTVPNKLLTTYLESVNNWLYTYKIKGKFKQCSKCGKIKAVNNDRFFSYKSSSVDGFQSHCKKCRNSS